MLGLRLLERWVSTFVIITVYFISHSLITGFDISCRLCMCRDCDSCLSFLSRAFQFVCLSAEYTLGWLRVRRVPLMPAAGARRLHMYVSKSVGTK